jgi:hypothetical protein
MEDEKRVEHGVPVRGQKQSPLVWQFASLPALQP